MNIDRYTQRSVILSLAVVAFATLSAAVWDYSIDDAFITFRYAENLADGHGLTFNADAKPVEGYSNFLWLLILSLTSLLNLSTYPVAKILGTAGMLGAGVGWTIFLIRRKSTLAWLAGPLFLLCPLAAFWGVSGLELGLHCLLLVAAVAALTNRSRWLFAIIPLFVISRPEAVALVLVAVGAAMVTDIIAKQSRTAYYVMALGEAVVVVLLLTGFRWQYFGYPFPNTYYAKTHYQSTGFGELARMATLLLPLTVAFVWGIFEAIRQRLRHKLLNIAVLVIAAQTIISSSVDPVMNFHLRYLIVVLPLATYLAALMIERSPGRYLPAGIIATILVSYALTGYPLLDLNEKNREIIRAQQKVIDWASHEMPSYATVSLIDLGRIPYYTNLNYNDLWGLCDEDIAHRGFNGIYEFLHLPDCFIFVGERRSGTMTLKFWRDQRIAYNEHFDKCYRLYKTFSPDNLEPGEPGYYYLVYRQLNGAREYVESFGKDYWQRRLQVPGG